MDAAAIRQAVARISRAISTEHKNGVDVVLVGIQTGGVLLAHQLATGLARAWRRPVPVGQLDISMHRDDLHQHLAPNVHPTAIPFDVTGKTVVMVDDVLFSGRTTRAALDALNDFGRPQRIQLAVLIDRGHRELPIRADFVGKTVRTRLEDSIDVRLEGAGRQNQVLLVNPLRS
jgi:pyrimidine operon attenuation protein/uracil phosphoribosyltransferase